MSTRTPLTEVWMYLGGKWIAIVAVILTWLGVVVRDRNEFGLGPVDSILVNLTVTIFLYLIFCLLPSNILAVLCSLRVSDAEARYARHKRIVFWWTLAFALMNMGACAGMLGYRQSMRQSTAVSEGMGIATRTCKETESLPPITDEDRSSALAFGGLLERAVRERDRRFLSTVLDYSEIQTLAVCHVLASDRFQALSSPAQAGTLSGLREVFAELPDRFADNFLARKRDVIEFREVRDRAGLLFRVRDSDGLGFSYVEYQLKRSSPGDAGWRIIDFYDHAGGSHYSDRVLGLAGTILRSVADLSPDTDLLQYANWLRMRRLGVLGDPESLKNAAALWDTIPAAFKKTKFAMLNYVMVTGMLYQEELDPQPYLQAISDFERAFPNDPALMLWTIPRGLLRGDYDAVRGALGTLRQSIPDPYLDFYIGWVDLVEEDYAAAVERARAFIRLEPEDQDGYEMLLEGGFGQGNHESTAEALSKLESDFGQDHRGVLEAVEWREFLESPAGKAWAETRR